MQKRWISLLLVLALVLAVWSVCAVAADAQKADEAADETTAAEPAAEEPAEEDTPAEEPAAPAEEADTASEAEEAPAEDGEQNHIHAANREDSCEEPSFAPLTVTGGKLESGETPEQAAVREVSEELDVDVKLGELVSVIDYDYPDFHLKMYCYFADIVSGSLTLKEHEDARWLTKNTLDSVDWLPADTDVIERLKQLM